jgi:hypothetical protein
VTEGFLPKEKLIYEVTEEDYIRWKKKDLFSIYFNVAIISLLTFTGVYLMIEMYSSFGFSFPLCFVTGIVLSGGVLIFSHVSRDSARARLFKLRIYENGFEPSIIFNENSKNQKPVFIRFEDIIKVEYGGQGYAFTLKLKDRDRKIQVESQWDVEGYMILHKIIRERYPDPSLPNVDVLSKYLKAHEKFIKKDITRKEFQPYIEDWVKDSNRRLNQRDSGGD